MRASSFARATCSNGGIARRAAGRDSASGPRRPIRICGCRTCSPAMCAKPATRRVLDETTPFLEGEAVPPNEDTWIVIPRVSRESATVYEHARLAIDFTLEHLGANGLAAPAGRRLERRHRRARPPRHRDQRLDGLLSLQRARRLRLPRAPAKRTRRSPPAARRRSPGSARRSRSAGAATITCSTSPTTDARSTFATR